MVVVARDVNFANHEDNKNKHNYFLIKFLYLF